MRYFVRFSILAIVASVLWACGPSSSTRSTFDGPDYSGPAFDNVLVIGVAGDYNSRASFERMLAKDLSANGTAATPYYTLVDVDAPIDRPNVTEQVEAGNFDSVLITRVLNRDVENKLKVGSSATKKIRQDGGVIDLFRYDYEELNEPVTLSMDLNVVIEVEMFSVQSEGRVWAIESDLSHHHSREELTLDAIAIVSRELRRDGLVK